MYKLSEDIDNISSEFVSMQIQLESPLLHHTTSSNDEIGKPITCRTNIAMDFTALI